MGVAAGLALSMVAGLGPRMARAEPPVPSAAAEVSQPDEPPPQQESRPVRGPARWYQTPLSDPSRFSVAGHLEGQVVGLAFGVRAEALYRPFRPDRGANLRVGVGLQGGPELAYLPVDIGWRQHFVPHRILTLELGAGFEQQSFFSRGLVPPVTRPAFYGEAGFAFQVTPGGWLGAQIVPSFAPFQAPGPSLAVRVGFRWTLGTRRAAARTPALGPD